jgi:tetratricopeptide (TPR) repeat protein
MYKIFWLLCIVFSSAAASLEKLEQNIINNPRDYASCYNAGVHVFKQKDYARAAEFFSVALQNSESAMSAQREHILYNRGNAYAKLKKYQQALEDFESVVRENPENKIAQQKIADMRRLLEEEKSQKPESEQDKQEEKKDKEKSQEKRSEQKEQKEQEEKSDDQQESPEQNTENKKTQEHNIPQDKCNDKDENGPEQPGSEQSVPEQSALEKKLCALLDEQEKESQQRYMKAQVVQGKQNGVPHEHNW